MSRAKGRWRAWLFLLPVLLAATPLAARELNLYDWMGVAPAVVHADVQQKSGKFVDLQVLEVLRGEIGGSARITLNLRRANRERLSSQAQLELPPGASFLLLLRPAARGRGTALPEFELVRGVLGVREVPEGSGALLAAARTLVAIQDEKNERFTWRSMRRFLEDTNPILILTALDHHLKFRRGEPELIPAVRPLLDHPRPDIRESSARLIGEIAQRRPERELPEAALLHAELAGRARRDPEAGVRAAATEALHHLGAEGTDELLRRIAEQDPEQLVRYTAERMLYDRRAAGQDAADRP